jgi:PAS domain-containing protein
MKSTAVSWGAMGFNLPENSDSAMQRDILEALPVLVFLERAGKIVFANAEARQLPGLEQDEAFERPVEDVLWGVFPGAAEPQTLLTCGPRGNPRFGWPRTPAGRSLPLLEGCAGFLTVVSRRCRSRL